MSAAEKLFGPSSRKPQVVGEGGLGQLERVEGGAIERVQCRGDASDVAKEDLFDMGANLGPANTQERQRLVERHRCRFHIRHQDAVPNLEFDSAPRD